jgi:hypothetical protein
MALLLITYSSVAQGMFRNTEFSIYCSAISQKISLSAISRLVEHLPAIVDNNNKEFLPKVLENLSPKVLSSLFFLQKLFT